MKVRKRKRSSPRSLSPPTPTLSHHVAALHQALLPAVFPGIGKLCPGDHSQHLVMLDKRVNEEMSECTDDLLNLSHNSKVNE